MHIALHTSARKVTGSSAKSNYERSGSTFGLPPGLSFRVPPTPEVSPLCVPGGFTRGASCSGFTYTKTLALPTIDRGTSRYRDRSFVHLSTRELT